MMKGANYSGEPYFTHVALHHQYAPQAGWVSCVVETVEQAENTKRLIRQAYDNCVSLRTSDKQAN